HLDGGTYLLQGGDFGAIIYFNGGTFTQRGGNLSSEAAVFRGSYELAGGLHSGATKVGWTDGYTLGNGSLLQNGGTNSGALEIGTYGYGTYTLSNGVLAASGLSVGERGSFYQWGGITTVTGAVSAAQGYVDRNVIGYGSVTLNGRTFLAPAMAINGAYRQNGGTNTIAGDMTLA